MAKRVRYKGDLIPRIRDLIWWIYKFIYFKRVFTKCWWLRSNRINCYFWI